MRKFAITLLLVATLIRGVMAIPPAGSREQSLELAAQVRKIFEAKCADCHGEHLPKPKGKFGYILDLARVGKNPEYIRLGDVEKSELYQMVLHNEMPGVDADVPPLTPAELALVARWINLGAPGELSKKAGKLPVVAVSREPQPFLKRALNWLGKFHPLTTHFPIALLLVAVLAEAAAWWLRRPEWTLLVRFLVVLGALSSIPAAVLGWLAMGYEGQLSTVYSLHKWLGTFTAVWACVCAVLICMAECEEGSVERRRFRGALLLGAALISITGFLGGALVAGGLDHYKF